MLALTIHQPYAGMIVVCDKRTENRHRWRYRHRGEIAIHAGLADLPEYSTDPRIDPALQRHGELTLAEAGLLTWHGGIIGLASIVGVHTPGYRCCEDVWADQPSLTRARVDLVHVQLDDVVQLREPVPCRGQQGLWRVPDDVAAEVDRLRAA